MSKLPDQVTIQYSHPHSIFSTLEHPDFFQMIARGNISEIYQTFESMRQRDIEFYIQQLEKDGRCIIHFSCYLDLPMITLYLMTYNANPFDSDNFKQNAFHAMAYKGNYETTAIVLNFEKHRLRQGLYEGIQALKSKHGMSKFDISGTSENIAMTPSLAADLELKRKKVLFDIDLEEMLKQYYADLAIAYNTALLQLDHFGRNPFHYAALSKFTWCCKTIETLTAVDKNVGWHEFLETIKQLNKLEWRRERHLDPRRYKDIVQVIQKMLLPHIFKRARKQFQSDIRKIFLTAVNTQDNNCQSPLHLAAHSGDYNLVRLFISLGADPNLRDSVTNATPLELASTKTVMRYLTNLEELASKGDERGFKHLVNSGYDVDQPKNQFMLGSVHRAVMKKKGMLNTVLECEGNADAVEWNLYTALHYAAMNGSLEDAALLISQGANVQAKSQYKLTPLHMAASNNHPELIKLLLQNNAKINAKDHHKCTPLHLAAKKGSLKALKLLLLEGADIYAQDFRKWTALHYSSFHGKARVVAELVRWDTDFGKLVNMKNSQGKTAQSISSDKKLKQAFISNSYTAMWSAAASGNLDEIRLLLKRRRKVNVQTEFMHLSPLMLAVRNQHVLTVKLLLEHKARVDFLDISEVYTDGMSAVEYANQTRNEKIIQMIQDQIPSHEEDTLLNQERLEAMRSESRALASTDV